MPQATKVTPKIRTKMFPALPQNLCFRSEDRRVWDQTPIQLGYTQHPQLLGCLQWPLALELLLSLFFCLVDIKLLSAEATSPIWEVSAGRIWNIWTARSASNNAAFVPLPYSLLTSQL